MVKANRRFIGQSRRDMSYLQFINGTFLVDSSSSSFRIIDGTQAFLFIFMGLFLSVPSLSILEAHFQSVNFKGVFTDSKQIIVREMVETGLAD